MEDEFISSLSFKPKISSHSKSIIHNLNKKNSKNNSKDKYLPIYDEKRLKDIQNHKNSSLEALIMRINQERNLKKQEEDEILNYVAQKTNSSKYNEQEFLEHLESNLKAYHEKKKSEQKKFSEKYDDISFRPNINSKSK